MTTQRKIKTVLPEISTYNVLCSEDVHERGEVIVEEENAAHAVVVYSDYGISKQMQQHIESARRHYKLVEFRKIGKIQ